MTDSNDKRLADWGRIYAAEQLMHGAWEMIFDALWESKESGDLLGVSDRLEKLMNDAQDLIAEMQCETKPIFPHSRAV